MLNRQPFILEARHMAKPLNALGNSLGNSVIVAAKGNKEYRGVLDGFDPHMNLVLKQAEVLQGGETQRKANVLLVRGDNVIYISP